MFKTRSLYLALAATAILAACGGGGGGSGGTTTPPTTPTTPSQPASAPTTPAQPTGPAPSATIAPPSYAASSVEVGIYQKLNAIRQASAFGTLAQDALLDKAGRNMSDYVIANYVLPSGEFDLTMYETDPSTGWQRAHTQTAGKPFFTGVLPSDRFRAQGVTNYSLALENGAFYYSNYDAATAADWCVDGWMRSRSHRQAALHPQVNAMGLGVSVGQIKTPSGDVASTCYLELTAPAIPLVYNTTWSGVYPSEGSVVNFVSDFYGKGLSVSISFDAQVATIQTFTVTNRNTGVPVQGNIIFSGMDRSVYSNIAFFEPLAPLAENTTYDVVFNGMTTVNQGSARTINRSWSFSTGTDKYKGTTTAAHGVNIPRARGV